VQTVVADVFTCDRSNVSTPLRLAADVDVFKSLVERSGLCLASLDLDLRVIEANSDFIAQFGDGGASIAGRSVYDFMHPGVHAPLRRQFEKIIEGRRLRFVEHLTGIGPRDAVFTGDITGIAVHGSSGELTMIAVVVNPDKTESSTAVVVDRNRILTELDARILEGIAIGESTVRLACRLFLSRQGVEYHVGTMLRRLKAPNRAALVSRAYSMGVLSVATWPPKVSPDFVK
jgi:PAS domain S-box-containing protein